MLTMELGNGEFVLAYLASLGIISTFRLQIARHVHPSDAANAVAPQGDPPVTSSIFVISGDLYPMGTKMIP